MQSRINSCVSSHEVLISDWEEIHLIDWKNYTNENLKIHQKSQVHPNTGNEIGSVCLYNAGRIVNVIDAFGENALNHTKKIRSKQCECVVYPESCDTEEWVLFVEMKYAESEFAALAADSDYSNKMINQIVETVQFFRAKQIISTDKDVYALISFPNLLASFNSSILSQTQINNIFLDNGIIIRAGNNANILSSTELHLLG